MFAAGAGGSAGIGLAGVRTCHLARSTAAAHGPTSAPERELELELDD
ncbi:hypothetical protein [Streptomyces sp. NBC_00391]